MQSKALVINDLSSFGKCSLTAAIAVLSAMNIQPCPLPTAVLSSQSEFPNFFCKDLTEIMPEYKKAWLQNGERFDGICTGYFANSAQLDSALDIISAFGNGCRAVLVDPVMGDGGKLYPVYDRAACEKMKLLASRADILTPNLTELCILTGADYSSLNGNPDCLERIAQTAKPLADGRGVIVTGIRCCGEICNMVIGGGSVDVIRSKLVDESFSGTGDIFSAVVFGSVLSGKTLLESAKTAARFVELAISDTIKQHHDPIYGVNFEKYLTTLAEVK